ncbi:MAG: site-2 protease family protein [Oscillospiraceae bacterium]|jgi:stage IV sporulation protein FB|nr:site-2 protease family protein [Oscillospiraceae bacterium]
MIRWHWGQTAFSVHPAFWALCATMAALGQGEALAAMLPALALHECGHVLAARALGIRVASLEVMPFGGRAALEGWRDLPPGQATVVALAGPLVNLAAVIAAAATAYYGWMPGLFAARFIRYCAVLCFFNLLPALPLDGGRAVRAWAEAWFGGGAGGRVLAWMGVGLGAALLGAALWGLLHGVLNLSLCLVGSYLAYAALGERDTPAYTQFHRALGRHDQLRRRAALPVRSWVVDAEVPVARLAGRLSAHFYNDVQVLGGDMRPLGRLDEGAVLRAMMENPGARVGDILSGRRA